MLGNWIDLRSDTVTVPTDQMRLAMYTASVGDDVYGDDPTINRLEALAAEKFGKEAALFVPSGTMSNQLALFTHVQRGEEVILPDNCHIVCHEAGAAAIIAGAQLRCLPTDRGEMALAQIEKAIRKDPADIHQPRTALITYENADSDGRVRSLAYMQNLGELARRYGLPIHIDGARIFNAATVLGMDVKELAPYYDTMSVCLSKGLCAPAGSVLIGSWDFIDRARRKRKIMGGGMRQVGFLAAPGILALEEMSTRLAEDHANAAYLAEKMTAIPGLHVLEDQRDINMVFFRLEGYPLTDTQLVAYMAENGVKINGEDNGIMRFATHYYVNRHDIDKVVALLAARA